MDLYLTWEERKDDHAHLEELSEMTLIL
jgi:hypothetical protein